MAADTMLRDCHCCNGHGEHYHQATGNPETQTYDECRVCHGQGRVMASRDSWRCVHHLKPKGWAW